LIEGGAAQARCSYFMTAVASIVSHPSWSLGHMRRMLFCTE